MMRYLIIALLLGFSLPAFAGPDTCRYSPSVSKTTFTKLVDRYKKVFADSGYAGLSECDKITIIRLLNTITLYKVIYTDGHYDEFRKNIIASGWLLRIVNDLGAVYEGVEKPIYHERFNFERYAVFFASCDYSNSAYFIKGLKREKVCDF